MENTKLKDAKEAIEWLWENTLLQEDKKHLQSDLFNIPAKAIRGLDYADQELSELTANYNKLKEAFEELIEDKCTLNSVKVLWLKKAGLKS